MSKRVADKLRGHARLLKNVLRTIEHGQNKQATIRLLNGVIANLYRDAKDEEQRGKDYAKDALRPYLVARDRELKKLGIEEQKRKMTPPRQEPAL